MLCRYIYPPYVAGAEIHAHYVSNKLAEDGHTVNVISVAPRKQAQHRVRTAFRHSTVRLWRSPFGNLSYILKAFSLGYLLRNQYDVIQIHIADIPMIPAFLISSILRKPYAVTCHGSDIRLLHKRASIRIWQSFLLLKASHVFAVTNEIKNILVREYRLPLERVSLVPNGYDEEIVKQLRSKSERTTCERTARLVFLGSLRRVKDPLNLIEAFHLISQRMDNVHLEIVGDGNLRSAVERKIDSYKLQDKVTLHGMLCHKRALEILSSSDIYILTSLSEGLPTSLIEAMALGKAVVATNVGGVPEVVRNGENGLLAPPGLPERLAQSVEKLLGNEELAANLRKEAVESVKDYSWRRVAETYQTIYQEITNQDWPS